MKLESLALAACTVALGLMLAGCGGGGNSSSSSVTLAQGSDPAVNGSSSQVSSSSTVETDKGDELLMMTVDEALSRFKQLSPEVLGLPGEEMSVYEMYPSEKAVPVDGIPCLKIIVYNESKSGTNEPAGVFLLARDGTALYKLEGNQVTQLEMG